MMLNLEKKEIKRISDLLTKPFHDLYLAWKNGNYTRYICKGGRGSAKSSNIAIILVLTLMKEEVNIAVFRKVADTLQKSVYEQIKWAIMELGVEEYFSFKLSPLEITYIERGNKFIFLGVDDPAKRKGIKTADFPIAYYWFDEFAEFRQEEEAEIVIKSILRGKLKQGIKYKGLFSYNPPKQKHHWLNKKYEVDYGDDITYIHHSTYLGNPYLSEEFLLEAEEKKKKDIATYEWEYMGKPTGSGIVPFPNIVLCTLEDRFIKTLDTFRNGIDWGYATDPCAFVRWGYDRMRKRIYAISEVYGVQISNEKLGKAVKKLITRNERVGCDNSEPKSVAELRSLGIRAYSAKKGKGSVESGEKWLGEMEIFIDPKRTPNIAREFTSADYATDRYGDTIPRLEDKDNHTIDATRYAFEDDLKKRRKHFDKNLIRPKGL